MSASDYLDEQLLEWVFGGTAPPAPPTVYVALFTAAPTKAGGGTEVSGGAYARVQTSTLDWNVSGPTYQGQNVRVIAFPVATAAWGTVTHFGLYDAAVAGNLLYFGALTGSVAPVADDPVVFSISTLTVSGV